ncbi:thiamine biosynthesis lipoprotein ApbE [Gottschalkia acidurici 9a]|uniref:FAD:protein FMN transferase n=1 Tax=Gottschalkia acidurici (strain ATCC 7906 / DSM 604 / BCRC 14475 / CIP 104303 / KCTC 5404 / NCIMB 10678 / 9a) TaxID=1128398 RepID=K0B2H5_GOTA9|nr:FAD:protein FMN transferase [Gottschalkia acidurici]AFS79135.1 thiamine biosynthesis lipoprotein ApbE [Gottschalkia acidurici 9a]
MKGKKRISIILLVLLLFLGYRLFPQIFSSNKQTKTNFIMGTIINLTIYDKVSDDVFSGAFDVIRDIENKMSLNIDGSELNSVNKSSGKSSVSVSDETAYVINRSLEYSKLSNGHFDITIGPLVQLWGIGTENAKLPTEDEINNLLPKVGYERLSVSGNNVKLEDEGMIVDLGSIAKGYAADEVARYLESKGVKRAIVDLGGNIYVLGSKDESIPWTVSVQNPFSETRGDVLGILKASNKSIVTSGVYERFFEKDGKRYHHILDPFTGYPVENELMSVSIVSDKSIDGDALSTSIFSLGLKDGYSLINSLNNVDAIFVTKDKNVYVTPGIKNNFEIKDTSFKLKEF